MNKIKGFLKNNLPLFLVGVGCTLLDRFISLPGAIVTGSIILGMAIIHATSRISMELTVARSELEKVCPDKVEPQA